MATQNYLISKTALGEVKKGFHQLPPSDHIYGIAPPKDKYNAREVIGNWDVGQRSSPHQGGKDYILMNKQGIINGCLDSKVHGYIKQSLANFHKNNEQKLKLKQGQKAYGVKIPHQQFTYGAPNRPSTPIKNVICNTFGADSLKLKQQTEAVTSMLKRDASRKSAQKIEVNQKIEKDCGNRKKQVEQNNFKLSKFTNVPSKIKPLIEASKKNNSNLRI